MIDEKKLIEDMNNKNININLDLPVEDVLGEDVDIDSFLCLVQDAVGAYRKMVLDTINNQPQVNPDDTYKILYEDLKAEHLDMIEQIPKCRQIVRTPEEIAN